MASYIKFNKDQKMYSHKHHSCGYKYLVAMAVYHNKCVFIDGPFRGGLHDIDMFRNRLKSMIPDGKFVVVDVGFNSSLDEHEKLMMAVPNPTDPNDLAKHKCRIRCRQETFNSRLTKFASLNQVFRHGMTKHKHVFEAVAVIVQYHLDNGSELFSI